MTHLMLTTDFKLAIRLLLIMSWWCSESFAMTSTLGIGIVLNRVDKEFTPFVLVEV